MTLLLEPRRTLRSRISDVLFVKSLARALPGVGGARRLDGVDPELVGDVFQPLQSLLVGFVVARHGFGVRVARLLQLQSCWRGRGGGGGVGS